MSSFNRLHDVTDECKTLSEICVLITVQMQTQKSIEIPGTNHYIEIYNFH